MGWVILALTSETWEPLAGVVVEAYSLDSPTTILTRATTDIAGIAKFLDLNTGRYFFKPRVTRTSGAFGEKGQMIGQTRLQVLNSSGATCVDAWVDPEGAHGTDSTIQAAITRLASQTGTVNIFIAEGTYAENLVISSSTTAYNFVGCGERLSGWPLGSVFTDAPLTVKINGAAGIALRITGDTSVVCTGIEFYNSNAGPVVAADHANSALRMLDCHVHNDSTGDAIGSTVGPIQLYIDHCILKGAHAVAVPTATTFMWLGHSWLLGRTNGQATSGLAEILNCFVSANNTSASIDLKYALARIIGCSIAQNGTGDGIDVNTTGVMQITNCDISGSSSTNGIAVNASAIANLSNNELFGFTNGVNVNATGVAQIRGHIYTSNVTNWVIGTPSFIGARAYRNAAQSIGDNAWTKVTFDTETFDTNNRFDSTTNNRYTTNQAGFFRVSSTIHFGDAGAAPTAGSLFSIAIYVNGVIRSQGNSIPAVTTADGTAPHITDTVSLANGDYIEIFVYQNTGAAISLVVGGSERCWVSISLDQQ